MMEMIKKAIAEYKKLKKREQMMVIGFICIILLSVYYKAFYGPIRNGIARYRTQIIKVKSRLYEIEAKYPEMDRKRYRLRELTTDCDNLLKEIETLEARLPSKQGASRLIGELTRLATDNVKLDSIRQKVDTGDNYSRLFIELQFDAPFNKTVQYLRSIESISPFLKIEELEIMDPRKRRKGASTRLVISSLLGEVPFSQQLKAKEIEELSDDFRNIFVSKAAPALVGKKIDIELEGITYHPGGSTAIIKGEVVREGSEVGNYTVKEILPNGVLLTDGVQVYTVEIER